MKRLQFFVLVVISMFTLASCKSRDSEVVDTEAPLLECDAVYSMDVGDERPSISDICSITDNSDDALDITSSGYIKTELPGFYYLTVTASDQSGNTASESVTIKVNEILIEIATFSVNNYDHYLNMTYVLGMNFDHSLYTSISFDFDEIIGYVYDFTMWVEVEFTTYNSEYDTYSNNFQTITIYDWQLFMGVTQSLLSSNDIVEINAVEVTHIEGTVYED